MYEKDYCFCINDIYIILRIRNTKLCVVRFESVAIQALLDDACRTSGVPGMSLSILADGEVFYFSSGYADLEKGLSASENTLYELASVSKAFTGMGFCYWKSKGCYQ